MVREATSEKKAAEKPFEEACERTTNMVKEYPMTSLLCAFSIGVGAGVLLSRVAVEALSFHEPSMTERLGRKIMDALSGVVPEAISKRVPG